MPTWWQNFTDAGSPPCSPQIPIFRSVRPPRPSRPPSPIRLPPPPRRGLAPALAADPDLQVVATAPAQPYRELDQLAHAVLVEHLERIVLENAVLHVERQKKIGRASCRER